MAGIPPLASSSLESPRRSHSSAHLIGHGAPTPSTQQAQHQKQEAPQNHQRQQQQQPQQGQQQQKHGPHPQQQGPHQSQYQEPQHQHQDPHQCQQQHRQQGQQHPLMEAGASWVKGPLIGAGAFGSVHQCLSLGSGAIFAVKSCSAPLHSAQMQALEREIALTSSLASLRSPHVITYLGDSWTHEAGTRALTRNLAMDYAPGGSISALLKTFCKHGGGLPEDIVGRYTRGILLGLRDIHSSGIAHLDIKGGNVLLSADGRTLICDFGASRFVRPTVSNNNNNTSTTRSRIAATLAGSLLGRSASPPSADAACQAGEAPEMRGTLCWMAPEVVTGQGGGTESDIWSLGCTVLEMLTGQAPWVGEEGRGTDWRAVMARIGCTEDLPPFPQGVSPVCRDFLSHCLVRVASQRWSARELLQHPFVNGQPQGALPVYPGGTPLGGGSNDGSRRSRSIGSGGSPESVLSPLRSLCPSPAEEAQLSGARGATGGKPLAGALPGQHQRQMGGSQWNSGSPAWELSTSGHVSVTGMLDKATVQLSLRQGVTTAAGAVCRVTLPGACDRQWGGIGSVSRESECSLSLLGSPLFALFSGPPSPLLLSPLKDVAAAMGEEEGVLGGQKSFVSGATAWQNFLPQLPSSSTHHPPQTQGLFPESDSCCSIPIADPACDPPRPRPFPSPVQTVSGLCWCLNEVQGCSTPAAHHKLGCTSWC